MNNRRHVERIISQTGAHTGLTRSEYKHMAQTLGEIDRLAPAIGRAATIYCSGLERWPGETGDAWSVRSNAAMREADAELDRLTDRVAELAAGLTQYGLAVRVNPDPRAWPIEYTRTEHADAPPRVAHSYDGAGRGTRQAAWERDELARIWHVRATDRWDEGEDI